jgi:hypothetical protein
MLEEYGLIKGNIMSNWQSKMRLTLKNLLMIIDRMHTTNQRTVLKRIQNAKWLVKLLYDESSNTTHGSMFRLDKQWKEKSLHTTHDGHCTYIWVKDWHMVNSNERVNQKKTEKTLDSKHIHSMMMEHQRGELIFKLGYDACMSSNPKLLYIYFWIFQEDSRGNLATFWWIRVDKERILELW